MSHSTPLVPGVFYHIYNRGNNGEDIFIEERNYAYFMKLYGKYVSPVAETYAYCLLRNHFHLMVRINDCQSSEDWQSFSPSRAFSNLFSTYTKAINKAYQRTGSLFEKPFKRKPVTEDSYFKALVAYIHQNPRMHGLIDDFRDWPYSSYQAMISREPTQLAREVTLSWFDSSSGMVQYHETITSFKEVGDIIDDE
jgi:REP element-mobilizing transposase RayT